TLPYATAPSRSLRHGRGTRREVRKSPAGISNEGRHFRAFGALHTAVVPVAGPAERGRRLALLLVGTDGPRGLQDEVADIARTFANSEFAGPVGRAAADAEHAHLIEH